MVVNETKFQEAMEFFSTPFVSTIKEYTFEDACTMMSDAHKDIDDAKEWLETLLCESPYADEYDVSFAAFACGTLGYSVEHARKCIADAVQRYEKKLAFVIKKGVWF
jgi:hypothetical protein